MVNVAAGEAVQSATEQGWALTINERKYGGDQHTRRNERGCFQVLSWRGQQAFRALAVVRSFRRQREAGIVDMLTPDTVAGFSVQQISFRTTRLPAVCPCEQASGLLRSSFQCTRIAARASVPLL